MVEQEAELAQSKIDITMSQIRPYFLYNTLGTLSAIAVKDGVTASDASQTWHMVMESRGVSR